MTALLTVAPAVARLTVPSPAIDTAAGVVAEPIVPVSLITKSSTRVTMPVEAIVIAEVDEALPIVPPSLITKSSAIVRVQQNSKSF